MGQGLLGVVTLYGALRSAETSVCPLSYSSPFPPPPPPPLALALWDTGRRLWVWRLMRGGFFCFLFFLTGRYTFLDTP